VRSGRVKVVKVKKRMLRAGDITAWFTHTFLKAPPNVKPCTGKTELSHANHAEHTSPDTIKPHKAIHALLEKSCVGANCAAGAVKAAAALAGWRATL
jgi:hypothetical protein